MELSKPILHLESPVRRTVARRRIGAAIFAVLASVGTPVAGAATGHQSAKALVRSGPVAVSDEGCGRNALDARVTIRTLEFSPGQTVTVHATVRNVSATPCTVAGTPGGPTPGLGPCNSLSMEIKNSRGTNVWPGTVPYFCPLMSRSTIPAGGHFTASGSWDQQTAQDPHQVPPGHYRLIVGGTLSFVITIR